jgi:hypothetical protein
VNYHVVHSISGLTRTLQSPRLKNSELVLSKHMNIRGNRDDQICRESRRASTGSIYALRRSYSHPIPYGGCIIDILEIGGEHTPEGAPAHEVRHLSSLFGRTLRACGRLRIDDEIYEHTKKDFPELFEPSTDKLVRLDEDWMKSADGKKRWRAFMEA